MVEVPSDPRSLAGVVERLMDNGYIPVTMAHGSKAPVYPRWPTRSPAATDFTNYLRLEKRPPNIGLRLDRIVVIDIDTRDATRARKTHVKLTPSDRTLGGLRHGSDELAW